MDWEQTYENWKNFSELEEEWREMLIENEKDRTRLEDCFYKNLEFGTGGMRGEIGPGPNRMNTYTVRKASAGLAKYIEEHGEEAKEKGVVIAYDSRYKSPEFAMEAALTLGKHGIRTYVFSDLRPTPELSFAVRYLQAFAGIVITASHNPPEYNGYKVYGLDGGQLPPEPANRLIEKVNDVKDELQIEIEKESELKASGYLQFVDEAIDQAYQEHLQKIVIQPTLIKESGEKVNIVFTPLHGTANLPVREALKNAGFSNVTVVKEQENPDPNFSTVSSPNPEEFSAFTYAIKIGEQCDADLILATDPDADRVGMAVKDTSGKFVTLTGNQIGALMLEYLLSQKKKRGTLPSNGVVFKTIVTSEIGREIASFYGIETIDTLTGFKFIGEKIGEFEKTTEKQFLFGYEESHGYLIGDFVRDKDAVQACLFLAEITSFYQSQNKTVYEGLIEIYEKYGFFQETLDSLTLKGKAGVEKIESVLRHFRRQPLTEIAGEKVNIIEDYKTRERFFVNEQEQEEITLPTANVLKYICVDNTWVCIRPSGTEPKIKFYFGVKGATLAESKQRLARVKADIMEKIHKLTEESD